MGAGWDSSRLLMPRANVLASPQRQVCMAAVRVLILLLGAAPDALASRAAVCAQHALGHIAEVGRSKLTGVAAAKPLSEAMLLGVGAGEGAIVKSAIGTMCTELEGDASPTANWLRGRMLLASSLMAEQGVALPDITHVLAPLLAAGSPPEEGEPFTGWALAYVAAALPDRHAILRPALDLAAESAHRAYQRHGASLLSTLLWTHAMNAYAAGRAGCLPSYERSVGALASLADGDVSAALALCPHDDYPLWLRSFLWASAVLCEDELADELAQLDWRAPEGGPELDATLALSMRLLFDESNESF